MVKLQKTEGSARSLRVLAIFLLLAGGALVNVQRADAQRAFSLELTMIDAGVWLRTHIAPNTRTVLLNFVSPSPDLSNYSFDKLIAAIYDMGIESVLRTDGALGDTAPAVGRANGAETVVTGSIINMERGCKLDLRAIASADGEVLGQYTALLKTDSTLTALLKFRPGSRARMTVTVPDQNTAGGR
jgi:hypothetical protein